MNHYQHPRYPRWMLRLMAWMLALGLLAALVRECKAHTVVPMQGEGTHGAGPERTRPMYDKEYFPTPGHVIQRMLHPYLEKVDVGRFAADRLRSMTILDPSAGGGALLKFVGNLFTYGDKPTLHAIEVNPDMQATLREQFTLVHDDFLTFHTDVRYDLILMNPPFSNGDAHLEHAWNLMKHGDIVCLLNAETIRNPHTKRRAWLVQLIADHGSVEYIGQAFRHSQRTTDVEVALVRLTKHDEQERFTFWDEEEFQPEERDFAFTEEAMADLPAVNDKVAAMVHQYQLAQRAFVEYMKAHRRVMHHAGGLVGDSRIQELLSESTQHAKGRACFNAFVSGLQSAAWGEIIERTRINDLMTEGVRADFEKMRKQQGGMPFTGANIHGLLEMLFLNREVILQRCVEEAFDLLCRYHDGNKSHWEGWKTNDAFKVNRKVILSSYLITYDREYGKWSTVFGQGRYRLQDIDRACAMLEGKLLSSPSAMPQRQFVDSEGKKDAHEVYTILHAIEDRFKELNKNRYSDYQHYVDNVCESEYFHIKFWKKGTIHLVFKDELLWQRFNIAAAGGKKWVPYDMKRKPTPKQHPADGRYAERLEGINAENRKLLLDA